MQLWNGINFEQVADYGTRIQLGMVLNNIGAPLELWDKMIQDTTRSINQMTALRDGTSSSEQLQQCDLEVSIERGRC